MCFALDQHDLSERHSGWHERDEMRAVDAAPAVPGGLDELERHQLHRCAESYEVGSSQRIKSIYGPAWHSSGGARHVALAIAAYMRLHGRRHAAKELAPIAAVAHEARTSRHHRAAGHERSSED